MKRLLFITAALIIIFSNCSGGKSKNDTYNLREVNRVMAATEIKLLYFHYTRRCVTCLNVEENSKAAFEQLYKEKIERGEANFKSLNLDDEQTQEIAKSLNVKGQALVVVVNGLKSDITASAFLSSKNYEKIKAEIKKAVDNSLKIK